ncbi:Late transcription factor (VLTF-2) [Eptesipox virus]|uniref:Viral late gene transcription factor 2 n=1 Tax=Eptesipox virus TaxID=1329402 RepID=A0A220T6F8_9POXV|nr:Late transcription factor (VLTF-2) [Eptesipox virus]ASK51297.1 Late transcription factor (VLTF-2) [Eptesipox virus]WAH71055.1 late transcription factor VLTF-2 [Eptesipox virus]
MASKRVTLSDVIISNPKSVIKQQKEEALTGLLPKYFQLMTDKVLEVNVDDTLCWFCNQKIKISCYRVETLKGGYIGWFCSKICKDSFATSVKSQIALREEPKISLLPLVCYKNKDDVLNIINDLKDKEGVYGSCFYKENNQTIQILLRSLI